MQAIPVTHFRTKEVDGVKIFYREAVQKWSRLLLLHGFRLVAVPQPMPILADRYRVIAPDYPGWQSDMPDRMKFPIRSTLCRVGGRAAHQLGVGLRDA
jgi:hypothetical protein